MWLTPAERRGALVLVAILLVGTLWDLWEASPWRPRHPGRFAIADSLRGAAVMPLPGNHLADSSRVGLDLNRATAAALDALPGIGPVLAGRIVEHRSREGPFRRVEDLLEVPGIGPRLLERLRPLVAVTRDSMQSAKNLAQGRADSASDTAPAFR